MNIEQFVNYYLREHRHDMLLNPYNGLIEFADAFKEQILNDAVETEVVSRVTNKGLLPAVTFLVDKSYKEGDKIKVILLPKED